MSFGVYIHFPFCLSKCPYCDFASESVRSVPHRRYAQAVARELGMRAAVASGRRAISVYVGGGTPSLWAPASLAQTLDRVRAAVPLTGGAEVTLEANPGASDARRFSAFRAAGINRLSIGIQSFDPRVLLLLGRRHTGEDAVAAFNAAREAGFENLTVDLIYGAPGHTLESVENDVVRAAALGPEHLSCYALTLEHLAVEVPMASWVRQGRVAVPDEDAQWEMANRVREVLRSHGYARYEISNYARPGFEARHNTLYWTGGEYLGLGCGASGFALDDPSDPSRGGRRWSNFRSVRRYLDAVEAGKLPEESFEVLSAADLLRERLVMGLRRAAGVDVEKACAELGQDSGPVLERARELVQEGLAVVRDGVLSLTERGLDFHSEVALRFV